MKWEEGISIKYKVKNICLPVRLCFAWSIETFGNREYLQLYTSFSLFIIKSRRRFHKSVSMTSFENKTENWKLDAWRHKLANYIVQSYSQAVITSNIFYSNLYSRALLLIHFAFDKLSTKGTLLKIWQGIKQSKWLFFSLKFSSSQWDGLLWAEYDLLKLSWIEAFSSSPASLTVGEKCSLVTCQCGFKTLFIRRHNTLVYGNGASFHLFCWFHVFLLIELVEGLFIQDFIMNKHSVPTIYNQSLQS